MISHCFKATLDQPRWLELREENSQIVSLSLSDQTQEKPAPTDLLAQAQTQIKAYLTGKIQTFTFAIYAPGTPFQQSVWEMLKAIPYGQSKCYQELATALDNPKAMRAVGGANRANPLPLIIPCHRVTAKAQDLAPHYSFGGVDVQRFLLNLEQGGTL